MAFDPASILDIVTNEAMDTKLIPCPVGEYTGVIEKIEPRPWSSSSDPTKSGMALDIFWLIDDQSVKEACGRDKVVVKQGIMLDMKEDGSGLKSGPGMNVGLGALREAVGMNVPGRPFSFNNLPGQVATVNVTHRPSKDNPDIVYAEIKRVTKPA